MKGVRKAGVDNLRLCKNTLFKVGVFPIRNHYFEPQFDMREMNSFSKERYLTGIDWNIKEQLELLRELKFSDEYRKDFIEKIIWDAMEFGLYFWFVHYISEISCCKTQYVVLSMG